MRNLFLFICQARLSSHFRSIFCSSFRCFTFRTLVSRQLAATSLFRHLKRKYVFFFPELQLKTFFLHKGKRASVAIFDRVYVFQNSLRNEYDDTSTRWSNRKSDGEREPLMGKFTIISHDLFFHVFHFRRINRLTKIVRGFQLSKRNQQNRADENEKNLNSHAIIKWMCCTRMKTIAL